MAKYTRTSSGLTEEELQAIRAKIKLRLVAVRECQASLPQLPPPRYDDVYFEGMMVLNSYEFWSGD